MMNNTAEKVLPLVDEENAPGQVAQIYAEIKREMQLPVVPNIMRALAVSPAALTAYWDFTRSFRQHSTLPESLTYMILYAIAETSHCTYCSAAHELTCRTLGIDEETLSAVVEDLGNVSPARVRAIIQFALKVSHAPQNLVAADYERLREMGVTDAELVEIVHIAAIGKYGDTLADALKIPVDALVAQALGR
jgi:uncharacterized peroxidase-related enzyme